LANASAGVYLFTFLPHCRSVKPGMSSSLGIRGCITIFAFGSTTNTGRMFRTTRLSSIVQYCQDVEDIIARFLNHPVDHTTIPSRVHQAFCVWQYGPHRKNVPND
jgi:hypothetical protein